MLFSRSTVALLLATLTHLSLIAAENAEDSVKVKGGRGGGKRPPPPKKTKPSHQPVPTHAAGTGTGFGGGKQDFDPRGLFCNVDSDCTDAGYPFCRCAYVLFGMQVGQNPEFTYLCASHCGANGCLPNCENCMPCKRDLSDETTRTLEAELFELEYS
ncbi:hypothetical protein MCOR25_011099 [Pyricularia grisea]|uniref:Uncharacterized protein n=1 Tax=Pyricularia grisea TaxID=148305 RepID=A0A6P8BG87_PYRGI|nr:uncharacterized protein PgNI_00115 [Pyricularia grisea]KAI6344241.1 hypothetical protein MCOR25_011099 [Pyricularia grisea]TLD15644.1 hypothetical protein PgNI_00115 [Pyricularia grisea]